MIAGRAGRLALWAYLAANAVSMLGDSFRSFTLTMWVFQTSHQSGAAATALMTAQFLPSVLVGLAAGAIVDRWTPRSALLSSDAIRALAAAALAWCAATDRMWPGLALVAVSAAVGVMGSVAGTALVAELTPDDRLERINSLWTVLQQLSFVVGPAAGAVCFVAFGPAVAFAVDAASFVVSFLVLTVVLPRTGHAETSGATGPALPQLWMDVRAGLAYLRGDRLVRSGLIATALRSVSAGVNNTAMVFFIVQALHRQPAELAWLSVCNGLVQATVGGLLIAVSSKANLPRSIRAGAILMAAGGIVVAAAPSMPILIAGVILTSIGNAPANIGHNTVQQRYVAQGFLGRVRGTQETLLPLCFLFGSAAVGVGVETLGARAVLIGSAAMVIVSLFITEAALLPRLHRAMAARPTDGMTAPALPG